MHIKNLNGPMSGDNPFRAHWWVNPWWTTTTPNVPHTHGKGSIVLNANGSATYSEAGKAPVTFTKDTDPADIAAASPGMAAVWESQWGPKPWVVSSPGTPAAGFTPTESEAPGFNMSTLLKYGGLALLAFKFLG